MSGGMTDQENKKEAALISVGLSTQLIAASLAFIAIVGGIITFVLINNKPTFWFYALYAISLVSFVASIFFGGRGIHFVKKNGESGDWKTKSDKSRNWFDYQTKSILLGIVIVIFLPFTGTPKKGKNKELQQIIEVLKLEIEQKSKILDHIVIADSIRANKIREIERRLEESEKLTKNEEKKDTTVPNKK